MSHVIFIDGRWETAAVFEPDPHTLDQGAGGARLQKDNATPPRGRRHHRERLADWIDEFAAGLEEARPQTWR